jgi:hypothetical protein
MAVSDLDELIAVLIPYYGQSRREPYDLPKLGKMHCPECCEETAMDATIEKLEGSLLQSLVMIVRQQTTCNFMPDIRPSALRLHCVNCPTSFSVFVYLGANGPDIATFPSRVGGLATPHTPEIVAYFVNQAYLAQSVRAYSASLAMYRTALDKILVSFGAKKNLKKKIEELKKQYEETGKPRWVRSLTPEALTLLKEIADSQMHANNAIKEVALENDFLHDVQVIFGFLLFKIYEEEEQKKVLKNKLHASPP